MGQKFSYYKFMMNRIYWPTTLFLIITPIVALLTVPHYLANHSLPLGIVIFTVIYALLTNLSITAGYHRLFSHRSYEAHWLPQLFFLLVGASAWQGSALKWSSDHRKHHSKVDSDEDPYSITKGFWYAHMGWLFLKDSIDMPISAPDLEKNPLVRFQDNYYYPLAIFMSFGFPAIVGYFLGSAWGGFVFAGVLRVVLTQQSTFLVNSLTHTFGKQTYSDKVSARDSLLVAFLTHGEGYHNFHHTFQIDYRNGIRWYQWDPTKWTIRLLWLTGMAKKLRKIPETEILKARLQMDAARIKAKGFSDDQVERLRENILAAQVRYRQLKLDYHSKKKQFSDKSKIQIEQLKIEIEKARFEFEVGLREWQLCLNA
ncbi:MAG: acyl-CoA desaturase [Bdellovibrionales bacterium]